MTRPASIERSSLARLGLRVILLLLPFLMLQLLELFVLPVDFFTFRVWEAALATPYRYPGAFYPNLHISKLEYGDRYRQGARQARQVEWFTDAYGFRNRPEIAQRGKYDVVVVGDSQIVGSFLDQKDTLTEVIGARSGKIAYSYAPNLDNIALFFSDPRFSQTPPKLLVVESRSSDWYSNDLSLDNFHQLPDGTSDILDLSAGFRDNFYAPDRNLSLEKLASRFGKHPMFYWLKAELAVDGPQQPASPLPGGPGHALMPAASQQYFYQATKAMQRSARARGMDFIMFVMPNLSTHRLMPAIDQLRSEGIKVLAYEPQDSWKTGVDSNWYWQPADSHWTEAAVRMTADEILRMWESGDVANQPFSRELMAHYGSPLPKYSPAGP